MNNIIHNLSLGEKKSINRYMKGAEPFFHYNQDSKIGVLLLHGFTSSPFQFMELREFLQNSGYTIYAPVIAGHGTTPEHLRKTSINDWINSLEDAYNKLQKKCKHIVIIGNSFGGNLAFYLAHKNDPKILGVISIGTPIYLRYDKFIKLRTYSYGFFRKFYKKPARLYTTGYIDVNQVVAYPVVPMKSFRNLLNFIKYFTIPSLPHIRVPVLLIHAQRDTISHPKSVQFLHEHLGSENKKVLWVDGSMHLINDVLQKEDVFKLIHSHILELLNHLNNKNILSQ